MARKRKWIDRKLMKELAKAQLTMEEMAGCLRVSKDTLERRYAAPIKEWRGQGVASMRRRLFLTAQSDNKGAITAMIFFLKNFGGMADVTREERPKALGYGSLPMPEELPEETIQ